MIGIEKATKKSHLLEQVGNNLLIVQVDFPCTKLNFCSRCHEVKTVPSRYKFNNNLVDSASSHTLVSKIKPCMSKYKYYTVKL